VSNAISDRRRLISVRGANLRNCHLYIGGHHDFFPGECYGASRKEDGLGTEMTLVVDGIPEAVTTDIPKDATNARPRNFFRNRRWVARFLRYHSLQEGDLVAIEKVGKLTYRVYPFESRGAREQVGRGAGRTTTKDRRSGGEFSCAPLFSLSGDGSPATDKGPAGSNVRQPVNVSKVRQFSPFRYPGGKTWLIPEIRRWLLSLPFRPSVFVEPFAGGAIASLTVAIEDLAQKVIMAEIDPDVGAVWHTILHEPEYLCERIIDFRVEPGAVEDLIKSEPKTRRERAFRTIVKNRTQRGGILAPGASLVRSGENGKGLKSRWYPQTLVKRILLIYQHRHRIDFVSEDGFTLIEKYKRRSRAAFFVDPPYTAGGKRAGSRLYLFSEIDHEQLFKKMSRIRGRFLMTYDDAPEVRALAAAHRFAVGTIPMKNAHHSVKMELLIKRA